MGKGFCISMGMHLNSILLSIHKEITCECMNFTLLESGWLKITPKFGGG
jgi:hypothetical protein